MEYAIVRIDALMVEKREQLKENKLLFTDRELIEMHSLAAIEISRGNKKLNEKLYKCTKELVDEEMDARINSGTKK